MQPYSQVFKIDYICIYICIQTSSLTTVRRLSSACKRTFESFAIPPPQKAERKFLYQATLKYMNWVSQQMNILKCFWREGSEQRPHTNLVTSDDTRSRYSQSLSHSQGVGFVCRTEGLQTNRSVIYLFELSQRLGLWDLQEMSFRLTWFEEQRWWKVTKKTALWFTVMIFCGDALQYFMSSHDTVSMFLGIESFPFTLLEKKKILIELQYQHSCT